MKNEIERKFFVKFLPDISSIEPISYERYFLERGGGIEKRISKVGNRYKYEEKKSLSKLERIRTEKEISEEDFNKLKDGAGEAVIRERYNISFSPDVAIQVYHGRFEGLIRVEVEFNSEQDAQNFAPFDWMGEEITGLPIARDGELIDLSKEEFKKYISEI